LGFVSISRTSSDSTVPGIAPDGPLEAISRELEMELGESLRKCQSLRVWRIGARVGKEVRWFELEV